MHGEPISGLLVITAVVREAEAVRAAAADAGLSERVVVLTAGVGRVNAAITLTRWLVRHPAPRAVLSTGIAGVLPSPDPPALGETVVGSASIYHEEGIVHEDGFSDVDAMGFPLLAHAEHPERLDLTLGNRMPADPFLASAAVGALPDATLGMIATVGTCSGTDAHAREVRHRTRAIAEAMEGAAVLHAAAVFGVPAIEIRTISNTTGDRRRQVWDLELALLRLRESLATSLRALLAAGRRIPD